jgi:hypothetical protein
VLTTFLELFERHTAAISNLASGKGPPQAGRSVHSALSTAPDFFWLTICGAINAIVIGRYMVFRQYSVRYCAFTTTTDALLSRLIDALDDIAITDDHVPKRVAYLARRLQEVWNQKVLNVVADEQAAQPHSGTKPCQLPTQNAKAEPDSAWFTTLPDSADFEPAGYTEASCPEGVLPSLDDDESISCTFLDMGSSTNVMTEQTYPPVDFWQHASTVFPEYDGFMWSVYSSQIGRSSQQ